MFFNKDNLKALSLLSQLAITMAVPIVLGVFLGVFLDNKLKTEPLFLIILILLGVAAGFRNVYQITKSFTKPSDSQMDKYLNLDSEKSEEKRGGKQNKL